jgi:GNAT superfamily N-acetyltransferase
MNALVIRRTDSKNPDFIAMVALLDADLAEKDGEDNKFYAQFNRIDALKHTLVGYYEGNAVACGAIKPFDTDAMEVKRMYVVPAFRGKGIATGILMELEHWAKELHFERCVLETGKRQPEAIALYLKNGYSVIPNYGQYRGIENSVCFQKNVSFNPKPK